MENNPSKKQYRGSKYIILALLVFAVVGIYFFSKGGQQVGDPSAKVKDAVSSLAADAGQQGKNLMEKAGEIKEGVSDTMAKGRDNVTAMASDVADKAGEMIQSATDTGSQWVDGAKSATESMDGPDTGTTPSDDPSMQAAKTFTDDVSQAKAAMGESSSTMTDVEASDAPTDRAGRQMADAGDQMADRFEKEVSAASSEAEKASVGQIGAGKSPDIQSPAEESVDEGQKVTEAMAGKDDTSNSKLVCVGPPPMGEDLGTRYIVASCETMSIISKRTGVGIGDLKDHNPQVTNPDLIYPNQELRLPPRG